MTDAAVLHIMLQAMLVTAKVASPVLIVSIAVGFLVSLLQSATQIQEASLAFVPKLIGVAIVIAVAGKWMLDTLIQYTRQLLESAPHLMGG